MTTTRGTGFRLPTAEELTEIERQGKAADKAATKRARVLAHADDPVCPDEEGGRP